MSTVKSNTSFLFQSVKVGYSNTPGSNRHQAWRQRQEPYLMAENNLCRKWVYYLLGCPYEKKEPVAKPASSCLLLVWLGARLEEVTRQTGIKRVY